jgi:hypothetical protein
MGRRCEQPAQAAQSETLHCRQDGYPEGGRRSCDCRSEEQITEQQHQSPGEVPYSVLSTQHQGPSSTRRTADRCALRHRLALSTLGRHMGRRAAHMHRSNTFMQLVMPVVASSSTSTCMHYGPKVALPMLQLSKTTPLCSGMMWHFAWASVRILQPSSG